MVKKIKSLLGRKKDQKSKILVDIHSHVLPGLDDGSKSIEQSLQLVKGLSDLGYTKLIATPHISEIYPNSKETIEVAYASLQKSLKQHDIKVTVEYAAEYLLDDNFLKLIEKNDLLTFGDDYLLFELPYISKPLNLYEVVYDIQELGYKPVLAHPERYIYFHNNIEEYTNLKDSGVLLQLNLNSLVGYYSKPVQKTAVSLLKLGLIDIVGSDTHHQRHIKSLQTVLDTRLYKTLFEKNDIINDQFI